VAETGGSEEKRKRARGVDELLRITLLVPEVVDIGAHSRCSGAGPGVLASLPPRTVALHPSDLCPCWQGLNIVQLRHHCLPSWRCRWTTWSLTRTESYVCKMQQRNSTLLHGLLRRLQR